MKILLLGKNGLLGGEIMAHCAIAFAPTHAELDLLDGSSIQAYLEQHRPDLVINATAYSQVDLAEEEPEKAYALNEHAVANLVRACDRVGASLMHFSTDFVFDGTKREPYVETDATGPLGVYGASKLAGERPPLESAGAHYVFRVSWLYGARGKNFFSGVRQWLQEDRELNIVSDQVSCPNDVTALAQMLARWIDKAQASGDVKAFLQQHRGLYHFSQPDIMSRYTFAQRIAQELGPVARARIKPVPASTYPMKAGRPMYSAMSSAKFEAAFGLRF
jgi:dTDP-4-dehydrorhamnose reductase